MEWVRQASEYAFELVQKQLKTSAVRQKTLYDRNNGTPKFEIGSTMWRYYPPHAKRKFRKGWTGPYLIIGKVSDLCYIIQKTRQAKALVVHVDHLKEYQGLRSLKSWLTVENDKRQAQVEPPLLDQAAEEEVRLLLTPLLPEPGNGPLESGPVEDIEESLLEQAGEEEMRHLPNPLLPVPGDKSVEEGLVEVMDGGSDLSDQAGEIVEGSALQASPFLDPGSSSEDKQSAPLMKHSRTEQIKLRANLSKKNNQLEGSDVDDESLWESARGPEIQDPVVEENSDDLNLPLALRMQRRPKKPRDILDL